MKLFCPLMGRFGNMMFIYSFCRAFCEIGGHVMCSAPWIGEQIFDIPEAERTPVEQCDGIIPTGYHQDQASLIYTRKQVKEWFRFKPEINEKFIGKPNLDTVAHRRVGDYRNLGYVIVSERSYINDFNERGFNQVRHLNFLSEENPAFPGLFPEELSFIPDFWIMCHALILYRANSTFSWWAATLNDNGSVYSPVIEGLEGGKEQDVQFVEGNWPRFANLPFVTDLHLHEE